MTFGFSEMVCEDVKWTEMAQVYVQCQASVLAVLNLQVVLTSKALRKRAPAM